MRIPHIHSVPVEDTTPSETIAIDVRPEQYIDDLSLFEDKKSFMRFLFDTEKIIRKSFECEEYIAHLKKRCGLDHCGVHPNLRAADGFRIELHHTPFQLSDITFIVINKRMTRGESLKMQDIAHEIVELHYLDLVGIYPLCMLCHAQVHSEKMDPMFIPMSKVHGHPEKFAELYLPYMTESMRNKWNNLQILEQGHTMIENTLPIELRRKYIYIKPYENDNLEVVGTNRLIDFMQELEKSPEHTGPKLSIPSDRDEEGYYVLRPRRF